MKKRIGFVSNSSSSSFIMVGAEVDNDNVFAIAKKLLELYPIELSDYLKKMDLEDEDDRNCWAHDVIFNLRKSKQSSYDYFSEEELFGSVIVDSGCQEEMEDFSLPIDELTSKIEEVKSLLESIGIEGSDVKLFGGQRCC